MALTSAALCLRPGLLKLTKVAVACAGTPFWKLVLKQFDDLLVKASPASVQRKLPRCMLGSAGTLQTSGCQIVLKELHCCRFSLLRQWWTCSSL